MNCPIELVRIYEELGDQEAAQAIGDAIVRRHQLLEDEFPIPVAWLQLVSAGRLAIAGRTDAALDALENLVSAGWLGDERLGFILCCDVSFDAIREQERFRAIAATIEAEMAQQLESVRTMERNGEIPTLEEIKARIASAQESD